MHLCKPLPCMWPGWGWCLKRPREDIDTRRWPKTSSPACRSGFCKVSWRGQGWRAWRSSPPGRPVHEKCLWWKQEGLFSQNEDADKVRQTWAILSAASWQNGEGLSKFCTRWGSRQRTFKGKPKKKRKFIIKFCHAVKYNFNFCVPVTHQWLGTCPQQAPVTQGWAGRGAAASGRWWTGRWSPWAAAAGGRWSCSIWADSAVSPAFPCSLLYLASCDPVIYLRVSGTSDTQTQSRTPSVTRPPRRWLPAGCWGGWHWQGRWCCLWKRKSCVTWPAKPAARWLGSGPASHCEEDQTLGPPVQTSLGQRSFSDVRTCPLFSDWAVQCSSCWTASWCWWENLEKLLCKKKKCW